MLLKSYLSKNDISQRQFAARISSSQADVSRWASGKQSPQVEVRIKIEKATRGAVSVVKDWPNKSVVAKNKKS